MQKVGRQLEHMSSSILEKTLMAYARRFPIRRGKMRVVDSLWRIALSDDSTYRVATLKHGRFKMSCNISEMLQQQFYCFGTYFLEEDILSCWEANAERAKIVFDVGANAGIYSLAALAVRPDATVHAFEPTPEIADRLRVTAKLNALDNLCIHQVAVLGRDGQVTLRRFRGELGTNEGMNFVSQDTNNSDAESVQAVSLDRFCRDHSIALLKIDVQGHEYSVLQGAAGLIRSDLYWGGFLGTQLVLQQWGYVSCQGVH